MAIRTARRPRQESGARSEAQPEEVSAVRSWLESGAWTEDLYFALPETNHFVELSDGKLVIPDMPAFAHQQCVLEFSWALAAWNRENQAGKVVVAPYPVRLSSGKVREPDIAFYLNGHLDRIGHQQGGPPDVVVEVLSPGTREIDLKEKPGEYARAGVAEYWVVDPDARWIEVYVLAGTRYRRVGRFGAGQTASSRVLPGFSIATEAFFAG